ncbi:hypothetical protein UFOVP815_9 [uncultured Caudovirales phage]|uniref:Uncharacterized protein n=1 Tax=uncultured Caudovirales phage TaxID=2100421 RepID=A0A6J5P178_9CAUD|nr:hypothetical protein UFOVP815_9 [uncultured Caudovirales phage]
MTNIIRDRALVATASTADLVATYNALTGNNVERFSTRAIAERRVDMAIMAAEDAAGHRGVRKDSKPIAQTVEEIGLQGQDVGKTPLGDDEGAVAPDSEENPFKPGTMAHQLWVATKSLAANTAPREKRAPKPKSDAPAKRRIGLVVRATMAGKSKIHANSKRAAILKHIQAAPACTVSIADLDAAFGEPTRGYVHKLIEMNHLESVDAE